MKEYILSRPCLNWTCLAVQIGWDKSAFHNWMNDKRPIPKDKEELLIKLLKSYGYENQI